MSLFHIQSLIVKVKEKSQAKGFGFSDFEHMAEEVNRVMSSNFRAKYLKYNLYEGGSKNPNEGLLDILAGYLKHEHFRAFVKTIKVEVDPILESMKGDYYCYVRMNKEKGKLLRSPVKISIDNGTVRYQLKGGRLDYEGEMRKRGDCLFVLMQSPDGKKIFHHIYKVGEMTAPNVLQGIFSGVSTALEPIGGRAILWRSEKTFDSLSPKKIEIDLLQRSRQKDEQLLGAYFQRKESNNISIKKVYTFGPEDLE